MESILRVLRENQSVSQRVLSEKTGISRGRLRRLEGREFEDATYQELKLLSLALGTEVRELFQPEENGWNGTSLTRAGHIAFQIDGRSAGYKITSFIPPSQNLFSGKLFVSAGKRLSASHTPRARSVFLQMILGSLRIERPGETYEIAEGDSLLFHGESPYVLENPFLRDAVSLLVTAPAFTPPS